MSFESMVAAARHLSQAGPAVAAPNGSPWTVALRLSLFPQGNVPSRCRDVWPEVAATFGTPQSVDDIGTSTLVEMLGGGGDLGRRARLLTKLAKWWIEMFGNDPEGGPVDGSVTESLRSVPGLSRLQADRMLCEALGGDVVPLSTGVARVAVRHGWIDISAEYDEAQWLLQRVAAEAGVRSSRLAFLLEDVARTHCGRKPKCEGCLLEGFLPRYGPIEPD